MSKFDNIFKNYILKEAGETVTLNTGQIENAAKKMANDPVMQKLTPILNAQTDALDTDKIHKGLNDIIDPKNPSKFLDVFTNESDKQAALKHLSDQGVPIGSIGNQDQKNTQQNQQIKNQNQSQPKNQTTQPPQGNSTTVNTPQGNNTGSSVGY
jgi:hypothetical protein